MSTTHWATRRRQPCRLTASCCATSQVMPMLFKSCCMVSILLFRGLPGFLFLSLISQCTACLSSLLSSIRRTCQSRLNLLSFMTRSIFSRRGQHNKFVRCLVQALTCRPEQVDYFVIGNCCVFFRLKDNIKRFSK